MEKHKDLPGSAAWHARRAACFNAGDASAMLGCHPSGVTRTQLLHALHTGIEREFSDYVQEKVIGPGHRIEALWRPVAEEIVGEDLQVLAGTLDVGLSRPLGASLDGCTFMEDVLGECKSANDALRAALPHSGRDSHTKNDARNLPKGYRVQCEQQQLVIGATRTLFSACKFDAEGYPTEERHCWYESDPALRAEILAGWKQLDADLAAYVPPAASAVEKIVAEPVEALPAVSVRVEGSIVIHENFDAFEKAARHFLEHRLIREPKTDQDFANLEGQIKNMKGAEAALEGAEAGWIAQIDTVSAAKRRKDMLHKLVRDHRLLSEKLLASEKERRKGDIVAAGVKVLADHIAALNVRLGKPYMPAVPADFGGCIRGLKSLASMEDKVATELARAKIAANEVADRIDANLKHLRDAAGEFKQLFPDTSSIVLKQPEDLQSLVAARIAEHRAAEDLRLENERARIRQEEEQRATDLASEKTAMALQEIQGIQQQVIIAQMGRAGVRKGGTVECLRETLAETEAWSITEENFGVLTGAAQAAKDKSVAEIRKLLADAELRAERQTAVPVASQPQQATPVVSQIPPAVTDNVRPMLTRAPAAAVSTQPSTPPTLRLGDIQKAFAPLSITAEGLASLGFPHAGTAGASKLFHHADFPRMRIAVSTHALAAQLPQQQAA